MGPRPSAPVSGFGSAVAIPAADDPDHVPTGWSGLPAPDPDTRAAVADAPPLPADVVRVPIDPAELAAVVDDQHDDVDEPDGPTATEPPDETDTDRRRLVLLAVAAVVAAVLAVVGGVLLAQSRDDAARPSPTDGLTPDVLDRIDAATAVAAGTTAASLDGDRSFTWDDPSGQSIEVDVDADSGNAEVRTDDGVTLRIVDDAYIGRIDDGPWTEVDGDPFGGAPVPGIDSPARIETFLPPSVAEHVSSVDREGDLVVQAVDDSGLLAADPDARAGWLRTWGYDDSSPSAGVIEVHLVATDDGVVTWASIDEPGLGGRAAYALGAFGDDLVVERPEL